MEQAIVRAAEKLFLEKGFAAASTTQIAKAAGCNQALVHYYFRTKDNLFNQIFELKFRQFFQQLFDITGLVDMPFIDKVKHVTETHFDLLAANPQIPMLILNELSRQPKHIDALRDSLRNVTQNMFFSFQTELTAEIEAGNVRNIELLDIAITIMSLNVAMFSLFPVAADILQLDDEQRKQMLAHRKSENVSVVMSYLRAEK